jgi:hypothetical protein
MMCSHIFIINECIECDKKIKVNINEKNNIDFGACHICNKLNEITKICKECNINICVICELYNTEFLCKNCKNNSNFEDDEIKYNICEYCNEKCNICSQACGRCLKEMSMMSIGWK